MKGRSDASNLPVFQFGKQMNGLGVSPKRIKRFLHGPKELL